MPPTRGTGVRSTIICAVLVMAHLIANVGSGPKYYRGRVSNVFTFKTRRPTESNVFEQSLSKEKEGLLRREATAKMTYEPERRVHGKAETRAVQATLDVEAEGRGGGAPEALFAGFDEQMASLPSLISRCCRCCQRRLSSITGTYYMYSSTHTSTRRVVLQVAFTALYARPGRKMEGNKCDLGKGPRL